MSDQPPAHLHGQARVTWAAGDPREEGWIERVAAELVAWFRRGDEPIAFQTARVLFLATTPPHPPTAADLQRIAADYAHTHPRSAGADPLTRVPGIIAAVSSSDIDDRDLARAAIDACRLTHVDADVTEACALWSIRLRHLDQGRTPQDAIDRSLAALTDLNIARDRCDLWARRLAVVHQPDEPPDGGYAVTRLIHDWWRTVHATTTQ